MAFLLSLCGLCGVRLLCYCMERPWRCPVGVEVHSLKRCLQTQLWVSFLESSRGCSGQATLMPPPYLPNPSARMVEKALGVEGDEVLYVGDHLYSDSALAKLNFRWRTALVLRELEEEIDALARGRPHRTLLNELMCKKVRSGARGPPWQADHPGPAACEGRRGGLSRGWTWSIDARSAVFLTATTFPSQEAIGTLFDHFRLARQRVLAGREPGMGSTLHPKGDSAASSPLRPGEDFQDEEAVNETLAQACRRRHCSGPAGRAELWGDRAGAFCTRCVLHCVPPYSPHSPPPP